MVGGITWQWKQVEEEAVHVWVDGKKRMRKGLRTRYNL
jgi:hypothetical protein